ncbi:2-oxo-4-hydroxy-4-carboxy-5-ureidoimidazoline decarboxylase, partial [Pseudomonas aeruginosa]
MIRGELTASSTSRQGCAGIHQSRGEECARFSELSGCSKARVGFPFLMAVKGTSRQQNLATFG